LHDIELLGVCQSADGLTCFVLRTWKKTWRVYFASKFSV
jgi:hypothetical protein